MIQMGMVYCVDPGTSAKGQQGFGVIFGIGLCNLLKKSRFVFGLTCHDAHVTPQECTQLHEWSNCVLENIFRLLSIVGIL